MTSGFVLSGGGGLGAVQVGLLRALLRHDVVPDLTPSTQPTGRGDADSLPMRPTG